MVVAKHVLPNGESAQVQLLRICEAVHQLAVGIGQRNPGGGDYWMRVAISLLDHIESTLRVRFRLHCTSQFSIGYREIVQRLSGGWMVDAQGLLLNGESDLQALLGLLVAILFQVCRG